MSALTYGESGTNHEPIFLEFTKRIFLCCGRVCLVSAVKAVAVISTIFAILEGSFGSGILLHGWNIYSSSLVMTNNSTATTNYNLTPNKKRSYKLEIVVGAIILGLAIIRSFTTIYWYRVSKEESKKSYWVTLGFVFVCSLAVICSCSLVFTLATKSKLDFPGMEACLVIMICDFLFAILYMRVILDLFIRHLKQIEKVRAGQVLEDYARNYRERHNRAIPDIPVQP